MKHLIIISPMTILLFMVLALIIAIYVLFELFGLFELYQASLKDENITLTQLVRRAITKGIKRFKDASYVLITCVYIHCCGIHSVRVYSNPKSTCIFSNKQPDQSHFQGIWS